MKRLIYYIAVMLVLAYGCKKSEPVMYNDIARVQLIDTATTSSTFVYDDAAVTKDTVYVAVNTIGGITSYDRPVKLEQLPEYDVTYVRDPVTNAITDSVVTERPFTAKPGVHYVSFDDKGLAPLMVVKADSARAYLPVVLLRDASLKANSYRLRLQLVANEGFGLGETKARQKTIIFSDRLERFYSWRVDNYAASAYNSFGRYSTGKHQFMIDVLQTNIDEAWYQAALSAGALGQYSTVLKESLNAYNADAGNIASGKAPLRETSDPNSAVVTFP